MAIPTRIIAPISLALFCTVTVLAILWWQLQQSVTWVISDQPDSAATGSLIERILPKEEIKDRALLNLRQGDIAALRGNWTEALRLYQSSVEQGGGIPSLRKVSQAQLQLRDNDGIAQTITQLKKQGARVEDVSLLESIVHLRTGELVQARTVLAELEDSPQHHYGLALLAVVEGNHSTAQEELALVQSGWEPILRSHARTLIAAYDEYGLFPDSPDTHLITLLARGLAQVQQCELALPLLTQVSAREHTYRDAWIVQGYCELTTLRSDQAIRSLERAYNLDPQKPETQYFLARSYRQQSELQQAQTFFEYALKNGFQPEQDVRYELAETAEELGNFNVALQQYTALIAHENADVSAYTGFVSVNLKLDNPEAAYEQAQLAAQKWPQEGAAFVALGQAAAATGKTDEAREAYQAALDLDPDRKDVGVLLESLIEE